MRIRCGGCELLRVPPSAPTWTRSLSHQTALSRLFRRSVITVAMLTTGCGAVAIGQFRDRLYTLAAPLLSVPGAPVKACYNIPLSLPAPFCAGLLVRGVDVHGVPGILSAGQPPTISTPIVRLTGTWDGEALNVTTQPGRANIGTEPVRAPRVQAVPSLPSQAEAIRTMDRLSQDYQELRSRHTPVVFYGFPDDDGSGLIRLVVPIADADTVRYLEARYVYVNIYGWLRPV
jgi:hypothetical protein